MNIKTKRKNYFNVGISIITIPVLVFFLLIGVSQGLTATLNDIVPSAEGSLVLAPHIALWVNTEQPLVFTDATTEESLSFAYRDPNSLVQPRSAPVAGNLSEETLPLQGGYAGNATTGALSIASALLTTAPDIIVQSTAAAARSGVVSLPPGNTRAEVQFTDEFTTIPRITLSAPTDEPYTVESVTTAGFVIAAPLASSAEKKILWTAHGQYGADLAVVEQSTTQQFHIAERNTQNAIVVSDASDELPFDVLPPTLFIKGNNPAHIKLGGTYTDVGAYAIDTIAGAVDVYASVNGRTTESITTIFIDTSIAGTHQIVYSASDSSGNTATAVRTVIVTNGQIEHELTQSENAEEMHNG